MHCKFFLLTNKRIGIFFISYFIIFTLLVIQLAYLNITNQNNNLNKSLFVSRIALPDLAISTESSFIRHRSLQDSYSVFSDGAEHIDYFPTAFIYHHNIGKE